MLSVLDRGHHLALGRAVAGQLVCNQNARGAPLLLQQLSQQAFGGPFVPPALHQDVEHDDVLVHRAPQPMLLAGNFDGNLVEVPLVSGIEMADDEALFQKGMPIRREGLGPDYVDASMARADEFMMSFQRATTAWAWGWA